MLSIETLTQEELYLLPSHKLEFIMTIKRRTNLGIKECKKFMDDNWQAILDYQKQLEGYTAEGCHVIPPYEYLSESTIINKDEYLTNEELELFNSGKKLQCVKAIKERLDIGLKEAKDIVDKYEISIMENSNLNVAKLTIESLIGEKLPKYVKALKIFTFDEKKYVLAAIEYQDKFKEEYQFDFMTTSAFSEGLAIYSNLYDNEWYLETDLNIYKKILFECIKK